MHFLFRPIGGKIRCHVQGSCRIAPWFCDWDSFPGRRTLPPFQILRYTIQSNGKTAGNEVDTYAPDGGGH